MDPWGSLGAHVKHKLRQRNTYVVALVVGTLINLYGQILVPWLRGSGAPGEAFLRELESNAALTWFSVFLGFAFPILVGVYSSVAARWRLRRELLISDFPDRKPDPVFRVDETGSVVLAGARTHALFAEHGVTHARQVLGEETWQAVSEGTAITEPVRFGSTDYLVRYASSDEGVNVYLTELAA